MTLTDTVSTFLFFARSILETIHNTGSLAGAEDPEGMRLYRRATDFMDTLLLATIDSYQAYHTQSLLESHRS